MNKSIFMCYSKCSTCKRALEWLIDNEIKFEERDIVLNNPSKEELYRIINKSDLDINRFFNTTGIKYRELDLKNKLGNMSFDEKIDLLSSDGKLIKRPIFITDNYVLVGFKIEEWEKTIKK